MEVVTIPKKDSSYITKVNKAVNLAKKNKKTYFRITSGITEFLQMLIEDHGIKISGVNSRVKTEQSLKEKIIRRKVYKDTDSPEEILAQIQDIIGLLIECEFIKDEEKVFHLIEKEFSEKCEDGFRFSLKNPQVLLDFNGSQPNLLKNGTTIYKLDGIYKEGDKQYKFELQIKSLVQVFWSEIEHNIIYKNNFYMADDLYVRDTLNSIKNNLYGLDKMLELINTYTSKINHSAMMENFYLNDRLLRKLIVETFNDKIVESIKIKIDIKNTRDLATQYIMHEYIRIPENKKNEYFYNIIEKFKDVKESQTMFHHNNFITIDFSGDEYEQAKKSLLEMASKDFDWDLYFFILTQLFPEMGMKQIIDNTVEMFIDYFDEKIKEDKDKNKFLINLFEMGILCKDKYESMK